MVRLDDDSGPYEYLQAHRHVVDGLAGDVGQVARIDGVPDDGEQLEESKWAGVELGQLGVHRARESLGNVTERLEVWIGSLPDQAVEKPDDEPRIPCDRTISQSTSAGGGERRRVRAGQFGDVAPLERRQADPAQDVLLLERRQHLGGGAVAGELVGPGGRQDEETAAWVLLGEVRHQSPERVVGPVGVVEDDHDRRVGGDPADRARPTARRDRTDRALSPTGRGVASA